MIELILDAVKLVFSEDARKSASGLIDFIRRSPDWQKDICTLEATVDADSSEHAHLLGGLTAEKMLNLKYGNRSVADFESVYRELTTNAFDHGCRQKRHGKVSIRLETTAHYVSLTIRNPRGCEFDLSEQLKLQRARLRDNPGSDCGRGLLMCEELADSLVGLKERDGVKAIFYASPVEIKINMIDDLTVLHVLNGIENPAVARKIGSLVEKCVGRDLLLDLTRFAKNTLAMPDTAMIRTSIQLRKTFEQAGRRMVVMVSPRADDRIFSLGLFDPSVICSSLDEALQRLGRPGLQAKTEKLLRHP
jgi:anti-sigma regulatory factor (Ser/Thr protein kinase)